MALPELPEEITFFEHLLTLPLSFNLSTDIYYYFLLHFLCRFLLLFKICSYPIVTFAIFCACIKFFLLFRGRHLNTPESRCSEQIRICNKHARGNKRNTCTLRKTLKNTTTIVKKNASILIFLRQLGRFYNILFKRFLLILSRGATKHPRVKNVLQN